MNECCIIGLNMLYFYYESFKLNAFGGDQGKAIVPGKANPGSMERHKDRRFVADFGGSAAGMDKRLVRGKSHDNGAVDSWGKSEWCSSPDTQAPAWSADTTGAIAKGTASASTGKESPGVWFVENCLGRSHSSGSSEEAVWDKVEGTTGTILAALLGLQPEKSQLRLSSVPCHGCPPLSPRVKKNCAALKTTRPSFSKMRPALACILAWGEAGLKKVSGSKFLLLASIANGSISPAGWHPCWGGKA